MSFLEELNPQQQEAVTASDGPVLILAGPGSGKTRVLTHRVAWLVLERNVPPWRIVAVTFTNKASREMRERLQRLLGQVQASKLTLGTFHAICARTLRREADAAGISRDYVIFDSDDQVALVRQALRELNIDDKRYSPNAVHAAISRAKNDLISPEAFRPDSYFGEIVRRVYELYQKKLRANNGLDFDDLLLETVRLFRDHPDVLAQYQERYLHVLVDEFQDTNVVQYVLLQQLVGQHRNLFGVADEDQSIYRFRGADYRNITRLREDYPDLVTILLEENYRSTQTILDVAQAIIRHNTDRTDKQLFTRRGAGVKIAIHEAYDQEGEAQFVVDTIAEMVLRKEARPGDCAVMYRTNAQSRALEDAFLRAGLPYRLVGATRFYGRREVKDLIAYLRLIHNPADGTSLGRILNVPPRGIGQQTVQTMEEAARTRAVPLWQIIEEVSARSSFAPPLNNRAQGVVAAFHRLARGWIAASAHVPVPQLLDQVLAETGYEAYLRDGSEEGDDRWENVQELRAVAAGYADELTLTDLLADVALVSDVDNLPETVDAPTLLTLHSAKGLEFPVVFLTGLEEGLLPHSRALDDPEELAEERRLMYVGTTRAMDRLYITRAFRRARYGGYETTAPSRFLSDIPFQLVKGARPAEREPVTSWSPPLRAATAAAAPRFQPGDQVTHSIFGKGVVVESRVERDDEQVVVAFEGAGVKRIMGSYLR